MEDLREFKFTISLLSLYIYRKSKMQLDNLNLLILKLFFQIRQKEF
jgi:hypothetical protein